MSRNIKLKQTYENIDHSDGNFLSNMLNSAEGVILGWAIALMLDGV